MTSKVFAMTEKGEVAESKVEMLSEGERREKTPTRFDDPIVDDSVFDIETHVKEDFMEMFEEAPSYQNNRLGQALGNTVLKSLYKTIFIYTAAAVYYFLAIVVGIFLTVVWAIVFAVNHFAIVWVSQPTMKLVFTWLRISAMYLRSIIRISLDPVFQSIGQMFTSIRGRFKLNVRAPHMGLSKLKELEPEAISTL